MKTLLIIFAVLAFSSCKKDYSCECVITTTVTRDNKIVDSYSSTTVDKLGKLSEKQANNKCQSKTLNYNDLDLYKEEVYDCKAK